MVKQIAFENILDTIYMRKMREWRNQDFVRRQMVNPEQIGEEEHEQYLDLLRNNEQTRKVFVAMENGNPFAIVNFIIHWNESYIEPGMYLVDEQFVGKGYGLLLQYVRLEYIFELMPQGVMRTTVLQTNEKNKRLQLQSGGVLECMTEVVGHHGREQKACVIVLCREDWEKQRDGIKKEILRRMGSVYIGRIPAKEA